MRLSARPFVLAAVTLFSLAATARALAADPILKITGPEKTLTFTAAEFAALPRTELKLPPKNEKPAHTYTGVALRELLTRAGAPLGDQLNGTAHLTAVIVRSKDNYAVLFALAEFDEAFSSRTLLLADQEDGQPLPPSAAPLRVVAPGDKRGARAARQVTSIEIVSLAKP